jgi:hypothetical protein
MDLTLVSEAMHSLGTGTFNGITGDKYSGIDWVDNPTFTEEEFNTKIAELQAAYDAQEYARNREAEYPSIQECVHAILDDTLDALQAKRASVKLKYPKGG